MSNDRLKKMLNKAQDSQEADLTFKNQEVKKSPAKEKRDIQMKAYVTKTEKKEFIDLIGRSSESDALRSLILDAIKKGKPLKL